MTLPFVAGQRLMANDLNTATQQGAWTSYTPTWSSSGTQPTIGNGSLVGFYGKTGRVVTVRAAVYCGTTTTFGTGAYSLTLPFTCSVTSTPAGSFVSTGSWALSNASTFYVSTAMVLQNTPTVVNGIVNASGTFFGAANPVAWTAAASTFLVCTLTYESTS